MLMVIRFLSGFHQVMNLMSCSNFCDLHTQEVNNIVRVFSGQRGGGTLHVLKILDIR